MKSIPQFQAVMQAKCPKCRTGKMFATPMYTLWGQKMNKACPHCAFQFEIEPGYFYVAMLISYAFNIAEMVTLAVGTYILSGTTNPWIYCAILLTVAFVLSPFNFRYSRVILLHWLTPGVHFEAARSAPDYNPNKFTPHAS